MWNNDLAGRYAGFRLPLYVISGLCPPESRHTTPLSPQRDKRPACGVKISYTG
jgi:hypothetical protein